MTAKDAYMFPVIGSCVLFGLYTLFKLFSKVTTGSDDDHVFLSLSLSHYHKSHQQEYINMLLTAYFLLFGVVGTVAESREPSF
jgi:hypothetical protein